MKCTSCGATFYESQQGGICPACGKSITVNEAHGDIWKTADNDSDPSKPLKTQVAVAINTRRIALVLMLATVLLVGSALVNTAISVFFVDEFGDFDVYGARLLLSVWLLVALVLLVGGMYYVVFRKRLTGI